MRQAVLSLIMVMTVLGGIAASQTASPTCEETRAKLDVYAQVVIQGRAQVEQQLASLAVEVERLKKANADLQKQVDDAKTHGARKEEP